MKKSCFGFILLSILSGAGYAQTVGARIGVSIPYQVWKTEGITYTTPAIASLHLGANLNMGETDKISTQIELSYSEFGFGKVDAGNGQSVGPLTIDYLKVGCAIKLHPVKDLNIHIGPEIGFQITGNRTYLTNGDFGAFAGIEKFFTPNIGIGARYYHGFSDINEDPELKQKNRAFQFSLLLRVNSKQLAELGF
ncbi:MAG: hypothetical protein KF845_04170 [Cyclobacteriaceae bacterium]|nr:hypothetical protein [Cyclobacteriaceae bacterium]